MNAIRVPLLYFPLTPIWDHWSDSLKSMMHVRVDMKTYAGDFYVSYSCPLSYINYGNYANGIINLART